MWSSSYWPKGYWSNHYWPDNAPAAVGGTVGAGQKIPRRMILRFLLQDDMERSLIDMARAKREFDRMAILKARHEEEELLRLKMVESTIYSAIMSEV